MYLSKPFVSTHLLAIVWLLTTLLRSVSAASTESVLYSFTGGSDGATPVGALLLDPAGNLYGTASAGASPACVSGQIGCGVVFELSHNLSGGWKQKVLYTFHGGMDGANPTAGLIFDRAGNLYGTTSAGGGGICRFMAGCGTVFKLSHHDGRWNETVLYRFQGGNDGAYPGGVVFDNAGSLYGTTYGGGAGGSACTPNMFPEGCGIAFQLSPSPNGWVETILHTFTDGPDGADPVGNLVFDGKANFYGTTRSGGTGCCGGFGVFYELSPGNHGQWQQSILYNLGDNEFLGESNGVIADRQGNFYGTSFVGRHSDGTVFRLSSVNGTWSGRILYSFGPNAQTPFDAPAFDNKGNLYGSTQGGGNNPNCSCGAVFKLTPNSHGTWDESVVYSFLGGSDGEAPVSSVILDISGNIYGTTPTGGTGTCSGPYGPGCGVVYEIAQ